VLTRLPPISLCLRSSGRGRAAKRALHRPTAAVYPASWELAPALPHSEVTT